MKEKLTRVKNEVMRNPNVKESDLEEENLQALEHTIDVSVSKVRKGT
jgi:hypothetical protein